jgi:DMSO reductase anchor subunit
MNVFRVAICLFFAFLLTLLQVGTDFLEKTIPTLQKALNQNVLLLTWLTAVVGVCLTLMVYHWGKYLLVLEKSCMYEYRLQCHLLECRLLLYFVLLGPVSFWPSCDRTALL